MGKPALEEIDLAAETLEWGEGILGRGNSQAKPRSRNLLTLSLCSHWWVSLKLLLSAPSLHTQASQVSSSCQTDGQPAQPVLTMYQAPPNNPMQKILTRSLSFFLTFIYLLGCAGS